MQQIKYNGWTNYETWLVNLWLGDDAPWDITSASQYKEFVEEFLLDQIGPLGFVSDIVKAFLSEVDWSELYEYLQSMKEESGYTGVEDE